MSHLPQNHATDDRRSEEIYDPSMIFQFLKTELRILFSVEFRNCIVPLDRTRRTFIMTLWIAPNHCMVRCARHPLFTHRFVGWDRTRESNA